MLQEEQSLSGDYISVLERIAEGIVAIAFDLPIIVLVTVSTITVAADLLPVAQGSSDACVRMEIPASVVVLKADFITASDGLAGRARFCLLDPFSFFDLPDRIVVVSSECSRDDLLTTSRTVLNVPSAQAVKELTRVQPTGGAVTYKSLN
jgi:hypothetical protein